MSVWIMVLISILGAVFIVGWLFALAERSEGGELGFLGAIMSLLTILLLVAGAIFGAIYLLT